MAIPSVTGYSLWLVPKGAVFDAYQKIIRSHVASYGGEVFEPHVTLIGMIQGNEQIVEEQTNELARMLRPFEIKLGCPEVGDTYFQSVYLCVVETKEIMQANSSARRLLHKSQDIPYMPHLSLAYGDFPRPLKDEMITGIGDAFPRSFHVESIHLYSTNGAPEEWYCLNEIPFKTNT